MKRVWTTNFFAGGTSPSVKRGPEGSFAYGRGIDYRREPSELGIMPGCRKDSGSTVTDLVLNAVLAKDGNMYLIGDAGKLYKRNTAGTWSVVTTLTGTVTGGMLYREDTDDILIAKSTTVDRFYPVSNSPSITSDKYAASVDLSDTGGANTYTLATSINEGATHKLSYEPTIEPTYSIKIKVVAKGTGNWTVTMHDDANNSLATSTIAVGSLTNNALNEFVFSTPPRLLVEPNARTYHFHVTSTVADGTVQVETASDFSTADYEIYANRLIAQTNGWHPMIQFQHLTCIGNEHYLSAWEPLTVDSPSKSEWKRHRLTFPPGWEVTATAEHSEMLAIGAEKRVSAGNVQYNQGMIFYWDGFSGNYTFPQRIAEGAPYALHTHKGALHYFAGGEWFAIPNPGDRPIKVRRMPGTDPEYTDAHQIIIVNPNMQSVRRGVLIAGFPTQTTDTDIEHGIYSYGSLDSNYPETFNYDQVISTGTRLYDGATALRIGMVKTFGDKTFVSWRDGSTYGVDIIDNDSDPLSAGSFETLIEDFGTPWKTKEAFTLKVNTKTLPSGATITPKYKLDRGSWTTGTAATAGATEAKLNFPATRRFKEIQVGFDYTCTTTEPKIISVALQWDDLRGEDRF